MSSYITKNSVYENYYHFSKWVMKFNIPDVKLVTEIKTQKVFNTLDELL